MKRLQAAAAALLIACAGQAAARDGASADDDRVVARVDGAEITRADVAAYIVSLPEEVRSAPIGELWAPVLERLVNRELIVAAARADGIDRTDAFRTEMASIKAEVLSQLYMQAQVDAKLTDEALRRAYEEAVAAIGDGGLADEARARHILVGTEAEARAVSDRAGAGEDFAELAKELSIGPSGADGGDLGWFREGDMVPEFEAAAFALAPGDVSGPVKSPFGWHVIKMEERRPGEPPGFAEIERELRDQVARDAVLETLERLNAAADVEILAPGPAE